jgi:hypothetical protein
MALEFTEDQVGSGRSMPCGRSGARFLSKLGALAPAKVADRT